MCQYVTHALRSRSGSCAFCRHCHSSKQQQVFLFASSSLFRSLNRISFHCFQPAVIRFSSFLLGFHFVLRFLYQTSNRRRVSLLHGAMLHCLGGLRPAVQTDLALYFAAPTWFGNQNPWHFLLQFSHHFPEIPFPARCLETKVYTLPRLLRGGTVFDAGCT